MGSTMSTVDPRRIALARGSLRDAMGSLRNLEQLLSSMRVGPRAVSSVLPAVHASCATITRSAREILDALRARESSKLLADFITPRVQELDRALTSAVPKPMYAKNRLRLESVVRRTAADLEAARGLVELLAEAAWGASLRVDLSELIREATKKEERVAHARRLEVTVVLPEAPNQVLVNPSVVFRALGFAAALLAGRRPGARLQLQVAPGEDAPSVTLDTKPREGTPAALAVPALIEPTLAVLTAALDMVDGRFEWDDEAAVARLSWSS